MPITSSNFRIPNDNRPHIMVDVLCGEKQISMAALIDTGAQSCCISREKAQELNLPVLGKTPIRGSAGEKDMERYKIDAILLPNGIRYIREEGVISYEKCGGTADIIIGMDIIGRGLLSLSFDGRMVLAF